MSVLALAALAALTSCGGDGDGGGGASAGPDLDAFCAKVTAYDENADFSEEATRKAYAEFEAVAPDQIRGDIVTLRESLDADVVGDQRTVAAGDRFTAYVEQACGLQLVPDDAP